MWITVDSVKKGEHFYSGKKRELWQQCPLPEWMLWALEQVGYPNEGKLRQFACVCVRHF